jgi:hypothetical protein
MNHENVHECIVSMFIFKNLHCYFLGRLIPSPSIPSECAMDDGANDELVNEMDSTA